MSVVLTNAPGSGGPPVRCRNRKGRAAMLCPSFLRGVEVELVAVCGCGLDREALCCVALAGRCAAFLKAEVCDVLLQATRTGLDGSDDGVAFRDCRGVFFSEAVDDID